jgi:hypothetical protein
MNRRGENRTGKQKKPVDLTYYVRVLHSMLARYVCKSSNIPRSSLLSNYRKEHKAATVSVA